MNPHGFIVPSRIIGAIIFVTGFLPLSLGVWLYLEAQDFAASATRTKGTVTELVPSASNDDGTTYSAVFEFEDSTGSTRKGTSSWSSNPPAHAIGESVTVLYDPADPSDARLEQSATSWLLPIILGVMTTFDWCFALLFLWLIPLAIRRVWPQDPPGDSLPQTTG